MGGGKSGKEGEGEGGRKEGEIEDCKDKHHDSNLVHLLLFHLLQFWFAPDKALGIETATLNSRNRCPIL